MWGVLSQSMCHLQSSVGFLYPTWSEDCYHFWYANAGVPDRIHCRDGICPALDLSRWVSPNGAGWMTRWSFAELNFFSWVNNFWSTSQPVPLAEFSSRCRYGEFCPESADCMAKGMSGLGVYHSYLENAIWVSGIFEMSPQIGRDWFGSPSSPASSPLIRIIAKMLPSLPTFSSLPRGVDVDA
ncbi:hypothetical protein Nepgr_033600 [Nepenthes gracilis]|uniref:Uncharacterized protein n=1 Tax=Nepenthes gracilis TaxID=150966 RepID=A0AAD3Y922_NEPGR|nr:hypothetical protein Nepgr_033600 [Nepenthes gracilis]